MAGKLLAGSLVIDLDGTLITARSIRKARLLRLRKATASIPWDVAGEHGQSLADAAAAGQRRLEDTFADHAAVLTAALRQIPSRMRSRLLVRVDEASAGRELVTHLLSLGSARRLFLFTCGCVTAGGTSSRRSGCCPAPRGRRLSTELEMVQEDEHVAEIAHLMTRAGPAGRACGGSCGARSHPRRQMPNLTAFEKATGWRYSSVICTNIPPRQQWRRARQPPRPVHRRAAPRARRGRGERVRTNKAMGLRDLPSKAWVVNCGWVLAANIAADLSAWSAARPVRLRRPEGRRAGHAALPAVGAARPADPPRPRPGAEDQLAWPWKDAFLTCWGRLCACPRPPDQPPIPASGKEPTRRGRSRCRPSHRAPRPPTGNVNRHHSRKPVQHGQ